jgi:hypothetical protein
MRELDSRFLRFGIAALFGVSTPAANALFGSVHPAVLAGLLDCGPPRRPSLQERLNEGIG